MLNEEQQEFALECFCEWSYIVENYNPPGHKITSADIDHSSLLKRLLSGEKALEAPPPKLYSYPCYELALGEKIQIEEPKEYDDDEDLVIGQNHLWKWHDKDKKIVTHLPSKRQFQWTSHEGSILSVDDGHFLQLIGKPFEFMEK